MRYLIALVLCVMLVPTQAHACLGTFGIHMLFFKTIPSPQPDADLIAEVVLTDVVGDGEPRSVAEIATVTVLSVIKTSDARVQQGDKVALKYLVSSCGPTVKIGMRGTIIAKFVADSKGRLVLSPYMIDGRGHISSPRVELR